MFALPAARPSSSERSDGDAKNGLDAMDLDEDKIDATVLALLRLTLHDGRRAWKGFDWDSMDRLHRKGCRFSQIGSVACHRRFSEQLRHRSGRLWSVRRRSRKSPPYQFVPAQRTAAPATGHKRARTTQVLPWGFVWSKLLMRQRHERGGRNARFWHTGIGKGFVSGVRKNRHRGRERLTGVLSDPLAARRAEAPSNVAFT